MNTHKKQWPFLLIPLLIIIILSCSFLYLKHLFFSEQAPKLKIYQAIDSPDKKYKANDTISISIKDKKYHLIEMFKLIWDGDAHGENK